MYFFVPQESSLLMSLFLNQREENSRYKVSVVDPNDKKVDSITQPTSRGRKVYHNIVHKTVNVAMSLMLAFLGLFAVIGTAAPANANFIDDGFKSAFCSQGMFFYDLETRAWQPTTGDETSSSVTPYEKYGTSGLQWTVWLGAENPKGLNIGKDGGEFGGKTIYNFTNGEIQNIDDDIEDKEDEWSKYRGFYNIDQTCIPMMDVGATAIANVIMTSTAEIVHITNLVYQVAYESSANILTSIEEPVKTIVTTMRDAVFFEFLTPIIMISALWMAWVGLVKRSSMQAAQGAGWMILAAVASVALMSNPMWLPKQINSVISSVAEAGMTAVTSTTSNGAGDICTVPKGSSAPEDLIPGKKAEYIEPSNETTRKIVRQMQCTMWYSFMYTPWVLGEFGESPSTMEANSTGKAGYSDGAATAGGQPPLTPIKSVKYGNPAVPAPASAQSWALYHIDNKIAYPGNDYQDDLDQQKALMNVALSQLHKEDYNKVYRGENSMNRIGTATIGLVAGLGAGIMIVIVSMSIIILDVGMIILTLVSPLFFLIGVHPGFGRRIALGWLETLLGLAIKRIVLSLLLSVMLVFYATILSASATMPWLFSMILVVAVSIGGITYKDQILRMFDKLSLGGDGGLQPQQMPGSYKAKSMAMGAAKNAASMALAGKMMNKANNRGATAGPGDGSGAGARTRPTAREQAAEETRNKRAGDGAGAGTRPNETSKSKSETGPDTQQGAGAGKRPDETNNRKGETDPNAQKGVGGGAGERVDPKVQEAENAENSSNHDASSGAGERIDAPNGTAGGRQVEEEEKSQVGGAGHYTGPDGRIVDADGVPVPLENLSSEERKLMDNGGAGTRVENNNGGAAIDDDTSPSLSAVERLKASSPKEIKKRAEAEAKRITDRDRAFPPLRPDAKLQASAMKQNKVITKEKKRLEAKLGHSVPVSRAMKVAEEKQKAANIARARRSDQKLKLVQKKRDYIDKPLTKTVKEPLSELRSMASSADKQYTKGYVKKTVSATKQVPRKTVAAAGRTAVKGGQAAVNVVDRKIDNQIEKRMFHAEVKIRTKEIRNERKIERKEAERAQAAIPKRYRSNQPPRIEKN